MDDGAIEARECIYTARSVRFEDRPVRVDILARIIEAATMAPSAENRQQWRFVAVTDHRRIAALGRIYAEIFDLAGPAVQPTLEPGIFSAVSHLATHFGDSPAVILVGGIEPRPSGDLLVAHATWWASLLPAVQNLILAARAEGLGATLTTLPLARDADLRAVVNAPDEVTLVAVIPVGYPAGRFGRPPRRPVPEVAFLDQWGAPLPSPT